jgi:hypothetical protein
MPARLLKPLNTKNMKKIKLTTPTTIKFPTPEKVNYSKYIEPKKQIFETTNNVTTAILIKLN